MTSPLRATLASAIPCSVSVFAITLLLASSAGATSQANDSKLVSALTAGPALAAISTIQFLPTSQTHSRAMSEMSFAARAAFQSRVSNFIQSTTDLKKYRHIGVQTIQDVSGKNDHLILFMHSADTHRLELASVSLNSQEEPTTIAANYQLTETDRLAQPLATFACPDPSVQFIAFAPNNYALEIQITQDVAKSARAAGLKTVEFYKQDATRANYLAYMSCPNLKGNFYDGDANPGVITTADGVIDASELANLNFNYHTTNIWLACQAFNDPMLSVMIKTAKSQKYAAGQNDLRVGPSDRTAACAMNAALKGRPMTAAFQQCYQALDISADHWGFDGSGSDIFGQ